MSIRSRIKGAAISALVGTPGQRLRDAAAEVSRRVRRQPRAVDFFHDPTDPASYLLAQVVQRLAEKYPVEWRFHVVAPPASDVDPMPTLRIAQAVRDAKDLVQHWDVDFPDAARTLDTTAARWLGSVLIRPRPFADQVRASIDLGEAVWRNDHPAVQKVVGAWGHEGHVAVAPALSSAYTALRAAGHYTGATLHYGGSWYRGIERVHYLEEELAEDTGVAAGTGVLGARPTSSRKPEKLVGVSPGPVPLDFWFSFRSPYSYLAIEQIAALPDIELRIRPILPMADRGMAPPASKRLLLVVDAKREADRLGVPFGQIADPLGKGVEHCLAISKRAIEQGKGLDFLRSAGRGIWSEAMDVASYVDLRTIVERAGLEWEDAKRAIADDGWRAWANLAADDLAAIGLWGVPSFRAGDYVTWGQDRIPMLADRLRRHAEASA